LLSRWIWLLSNALLITSGLVAEAPYHEDSCEGYLHRAYHLQKSSFDSGNTMRLIAKDLRQLTNRNFVHLEFWRDGQNEKLLLRDRVMRSTEESPEFTNRLLLPKLYQSDLYVSDAIRVGPDQVIRIRRGDPSTTRVLVKGSNPSHNKLGDDWVDIVHIGYHRKLGFEKGPCRFIPIVFASTDAKLSPEWGMNAFETLAARLSIAYVLVVRNDHWFWEWEEFPVFDPYERPHEPPSREQYGHSHSLVCARDDNQRVVCKVSSPERLQPRPLDPPPKIP
jgi:hypothetical protein